ncbi:hypothetical protein QYF36_015571 [Acer negundo]|nr:hypothetical protein QYF36_015571 [Acer negundo]
MLIDILDRRLSPPEDQTVVQDIVVASSLASACLSSKPKYYPSRDWEPTEFGLIGSVPSTIGGLINLKELDISNKKLGGPIPIGIGDCSMLPNMKLSNNILSGSFPIEIGNLPTTSSLGQYLPNL